MCKACRHTHHTTRLSAGIRTSLCVEPQPLGGCEATPTPLPTHADHHPPLLSTSHPPLLACTTITAMATHHAQKYAMPHDHSDHMPTPDPLRDLVFRRLRSVQFTARIYIN